MKIGHPLLIIALLSCGCSAHPKPKRETIAAAIQNLAGGYNVRRIATLRMHPGRTVKVHFSIQSEIPFTGASFQVWPKSLTPKDLLMGDSFDLRVRNTSTVPIEIEYSRNPSLGPELFIVLSPGTDKVIDTAIPYANFIVARHLDGNAPPSSYHDVILTGTFELPIQSKGNTDLIDVMQLQSVRQWEQSSRRP
jgi:hypothetical protein